MLVSEEQFKTLMDKIQSLEEEISGLKILVQSIDLRVRQLEDSSTEQNENPERENSNPYQSNDVSNQHLKEEIQTVQRKQSEMAENLKLICKHLQDKNTQSSHTYPLDKDTDLIDIETKIDAAAQFKFRLAYELTYIETKDVKAIVRRIMPKLFTDNILSEYSWYGYQGTAKSKNSFSTLKICSVIRDTIKAEFSNTSQNENEFEDEFENIFKRSIIHVLDQAQNIHRNIPQHSRLDHTDLNL